MWAQSRREERDWRPSRLVLPVLLIVVGVVFLLNNVGVLPWSVWLTLARLWPVILILLGIDILLGRRGGVLGAAIVTVVLIAVVAGAIALASGSRTSPAPVLAAAEQTTSVPLGDATSGDVSLTLPAGALNVGALPSQESEALRPASATPRDRADRPARGEAESELLRLTSSMPEGMKVSTHSSVRNGVAEAVLSTSGGGLGWWPFDQKGSPNGLTTTWNVLLAPGVPLSLRANIGAGESDFDLTNLTVHQLTINSGAGQTTVRFPTSAGQTDADVHSGAGQLILVIPPDVGAYIHRASSMVEVNVPSDRFQTVADGYQTANYATATNRVDVTLHLGVGSVDVR